MNTLLKLVSYAVLLCAVFAVPSAHAQAAASSTGNSLDTSATGMSAPQTSSNIVTGLNETLQWVFVFLKFLAIIACAYGSYMVWKGEFSSGIWAYVAALLLFFAPALVDLAQKIGQNAAA